MSNKTKKNRKNIFEEEPFTEEDMENAKMLEPIPKKMFDLIDSIEVDGKLIDMSYKMKESKTNPDVWLLTNKGYYYTVIANS